MQNKDYQEMISNVFDSILKLTEKKGHDYARESDTLRNFKVVSQILTLLMEKEITPADVCLFFIVVKMCRDSNLKGKDPMCESRYDTYQDWINYIGLKLACEEDGVENGKVA
jgi:hypothetical protein